MESRPARSPGTLYLVATPIGNLGDLSPRALETLRQADLVVAEDTRHTRGLLTHLGLTKPLESFHGDSDERKRDRLVRMLAEGRALALVTDGGTPGVADPGPELVRAALEAGAAVVPLPGPAALTTALSASGLAADRFVFAGFPPRRATERENFIKRWAFCGLTVVLYEAPHRIVETLAVIAAVCPDRPTVVARELTKQYEEFVRGTATEVAAVFAEREPKGEFVVILEGGEADPATAGLPEHLPDVVSRLREAGISARDTADILSELGLATRRELYRLASQGQEERPAREK
jgi:16S rRNA (cytidine1402-2'-O)-methyltransferase